ncbi:MAG: threonine/serine dehydratase [Gaiellales bacterium]
MPPPACSKWSAPATKLAAVERLGGHVVRVPFEDWWQTLEASAFPGADGLFVHPVENEDVMAGNGTIGLEIAEDLSQVDAIVIPFGGGGLTTGVASATRVLLPDTSVYTVEPATANPLEVSLAAGEPCEVDYEASFVDGAGGRAVLPRMWPRLLPLVDGALSVSIDRASAAVRMLAERARVVSEGAGALGLAAVLAGLPRPVESVVCIVSGGNIDPPVLASILRDGQAPS